MKILIISYEIPPTVGGAGIVAWQNAHILSQKGHEVTLLTMASKKGSIDHKNLPFKLVQVSSLPKFWAIPLALKIRKLNISSYEAVIINDIGAALTFSLFYNRPYPSIKLFYYLHGGEVESIYEKPNHLFKLIKFPYLYNKFLARCNRIIAVSNYMKSYFIQSSPMQIASDKIDVIYGGVDTTLFSYQSCNLREKLSIPPEDTLLLSISRITKRKGYEKMANIYEEVIKEDSRFHWIVVGDGIYLDELKARIRDKGLERKVSFLGAVKRHELKEIYSSADLFWLLSERESFGLVYIECQLCGTPAMGPNEFGVRESIHNGKTGYLINSFKEAKEIIIEREYLKMKKSDIYEFADFFSLENQGQKLVDVLERA